VLVFFDLDGTLTDPFEGIARCLEHALAGMGVAEAPPRQAMRAFIGPPLRRTLAGLLGPRADEAEVERAIGIFRERFGTVGLFENTPYPGVAAALQRLRAEGRSLAVATAKPRVFAERILAHFDLAASFDAVFGAELDGRFDDKAELLEHALAERGVAARDAVMIGDRRDDVVAARKNGVRAIGVLWGYGSREELLEAGSDALCASPAELPAAVAGR
jgi:phosphoglycolate phosphatase